MRSDVFWMTACTAGCFLEFWRHTHAPSCLPISVTPWVCTKISEKYNCLHLQGLNTYWYWIFSPKRWYLPSSQQARSFCSEVFHLFCLDLSDKGQQPSTRINLLKTSLKVWGIDTSSWFTEKHAGVYRTFFSCLNAIFMHLILLLRSVREDSLEIACAGERRGGGRYNRGDWAMSVWRMRAMWRCYPHIPGLFQHSLHVLYHASVSWVCFAIYIRLVAAQEVAGYDTHSHTHLELVTSWICFGPSTYYWIGWNDGITYNYLCAFSSVWKSNMKVEIKSTNTSRKRFSSCCFSVTRKKLQIFSNVFWVLFVIKMLNLSGSHGNEYEDDLSSELLCSVVYSKVHTVLLPRRQNIGTFTAVRTSNLIHHTVIALSSSKDIKY